MYRDIVLTVKVEGADYKYLADQAQNLREELLNADIKGVQEVSSRDLAKGAKSLDFVDWGTLLLTIAGVGGGASAFFTLIGNWVQRNQGSEISMVLPNGVSLTIKGSIVRRKDLEGFVDMFQRAIQEGPEPKGSAYTETNSLILREKMISFLSIEEVKSICFDLGVDHENLAHDIQKVGINQFPDLQP